MLVRAARENVPAAGPPSRHCTDSGTTSSARHPLSESLVADVRRSDTNSVILKDNFESTAWPLFPVYVPIWLKRATCRCISYIRRSKVRTLETFRVIGDINNFQVLCVICSNRNFRYLLPILTPS